MQKRRRGNSGKMVAGLAVAIIVVSIAAEALAGFTFFIILPPALNNVNAAAWSLINFNPGTGDEFRNGANDVRAAAESLRQTGRSLICAYGNCNILGFQILNEMQDTRIALENLADDVEKLSGRANNLGQDFDQTVTVIHSVGYGALGIKDGLYFGVMTMLALGAVGILTGIGLAVTSDALRRLEGAQF